MIFRIALSQGMRVRCITMIRNWKASHLNTVTPLLPERKNSRLNLLLEYDAHHFLGLQRHHSPGVHGQSHKYQIWEWHYDPKEVEWTNQSHLSDKKPMLLQHDNAKPHTCSATLVIIDSITLDIVPCPPYGLYLTPSDFWLFTFLKKHLKRIHFTCDEEVQAAMGKCF
jgi:hypothetical protein